MITTAELCRLGAMPQSHDGDGWAKLERTYGRTRLEQCIVAACKKRGAPVPLTEVSPWLQPYGLTNATDPNDDRADPAAGNESTADAIEVEAAQTGTHGPTTPTPTPSEISPMLDQKTRQLTGADILPTVVRLKRSLASRGYAAGLAKALGVHGNAPHSWASAGKIPATREAAVADYLAAHPSALSHAKPASTQDKPARVEPIPDKPPAADSASIVVGPTISGPQSPVTIRPTLEDAWRVLADAKVQTVYQITDGKLIAVRAIIVGAA